jgi:hypothetical protein
MASTTTAVAGGQRIITARTSPLLVGIPVLLLAICNLADVATTHRLLSMGATEMNPVAGWLIQNGALLFAKMAIVLVIGVAVLKAPPRRWILPALWTVAGLYAGIISFHLVELGLA